MIDWLEKARVHLAQAGRGSTDETDERLVLSVSSAPSANLSEKPFIANVPIPGSALDEPVPDVLLRTEVPAARHQLSREEGHECHAGGWNAAEIQLFVERASRFAARGMADAEYLAERLTLRDRQGDDRRMCVECCELRPAGWCAAARRAVLVDSATYLEPMPATLMRCGVFKAIRIVVTAGSQGAYPPSCL